MFIFIGACTFFISVWFFRFSIMNLILKHYTQNYKIKYLEQNPETIILSAMDKLIVDYQTIKKIDFFKLKPGKLNDAGPFLNSIVGWDGIKDANGIFIEPEIKNQLRNFPNDSNAKPDFKNLNLNFSWFKELHKFDHWNYEFHKPVDAQSKNYLFYNIPIPNYGDLMIWSKARLIKGIKEKNLTAAIKENRDLAKLIFLNEDFVSSVVAINILKNEMKVIETLAKNELNKHKLIPTETLNAALRFFRAQNSFLDLRLSNKTFELLNEFDIGLCQRVYQAMADYKAFHKFLRPEMTESFERLNKVVEDTDSTCRNSFVRQKWADPNYQALFNPDDDIFQNAPSSENTKIKNNLPLKTTIKDLENNPELGKTISYILISIGSPNYLGSYYLKN